MNIGIVCYASVGGSGIVATELGKALASRGHQVHFISTETPFRFGDFQAGLTFHQVLTPTYPLFREPQYLLSIANKIVEVAREFSLDIIHAHYAVPHATAAFLAKQVLASTGPDRAPRVVTTLHGTDITLVGNDPSYSEIVAFSIEQSDRVTAVSKSLRDSTYAELAVTRDIEVIPNFLDCGVHRRQDLPDLRKRFTDGDPNAKIVVHVSNFRPVKRIDYVMAIFDRIRRQRAGAAAAGRRRARAAAGAAHGARAGHLEPAPRRRRAGGGAAAAVGERRLPAAVDGRELRPGRARGDGVRRAGRGVAGRRCARGDRARRQRLPARADAVDEMAASAMRLLTDARAASHDGRRGAPPRARARSAPTASCRCTRLPTRGC